MRRFECVVFLLLIVSCACADVLTRPREGGRVELRLGGLPPVGAQGWAEYARFLELNPDIKLKSVTGITVQGMAESKLFLAMAADMAPDVFDGSLREIQTLHDQRFCYPLDVGARGPMYKLPAQTMLKASVKLLESGASE